VKRTRQKRSDVLRDALRAYLGKSPSRPRTHAENVAHLLGAFASGRPGMSEDTRRYVLESLRRGR
jgi:hypothetical protein